MRAIRFSFLRALGVDGAVVLVVTIALTSGCADGGSDPGARAAADHRVATVTPELTVGVSDGSEEYTFATIWSILPASDGTLWVLDGGIPVGTPMLRQYDPDGRFLRHVAGRGEGPGEFQHPYALAELPDGRVLLRDGSLTNRINLYGPDGTPDTTWTFPTPYDGLPGGPYTTQVDTSGLAWLRFGGGSVRGPGALEGGIAFLRVRADGSIQDTVVFTPPPPVPEWAVNYTDPRFGGRGWFTVGYGPRHVWGWSPAGHLATGMTGRYEIDFRALPTGRIDDGVRPWPPGDQLRTIRHRTETVPVSDEERADVRERAVRSAANRGVSGASVPEIPRVKPSFRGFGFSDDGRLWVSVSMPSERSETNSAVRWREPVAFDVFEPDGTAVGRVVMPPRVACATPGSQTMRIRGDRIWCVVADDHGVNMVRRYRIQWP